MGGDRRFRSRAPRAFWYRPACIRWSSRACSRTPRPSHIRFGAPSSERRLWPMILDLVRITRSRALQIDFDAPRSARPFYRELLADLRRDLKPGVFLSITALTSWCSAPRTWLDGLTVDEIVPMDFQTRSDSPYADPSCRKSIGLQAAGTPRPTEVPGRRTYLFTYGAWSRAAVDEAFRVARQ